MTKFKTYLLFVALLLTCLTVKAQSRLGTATVKVNEAKTITLNSTYSNVLQNNASSVNYRWYSNNTSVASVSYSSFKECRVTGKAAGTCRVYFEASFFIGNKFDRYNFYWDVTVSGYTSGESSVINPTRAEIYPTELTLEVGQTYDMSFDVYPANATYTKQWVSHSKNIVTVNDQGRVSGVSPGTAYIYLWVFDSQGNCEYEDLVQTCEVTIVQPLRVFDENSTETLLSVDNANVTVNRTLNADKWSTICLPFAMSEAQTKAAFGNYVEIADFTGYDTEKDGGNNVVGLTINFSDVTAMEANHPYIIKVKNDITQFTVDGVDVVPVATPGIVYDNNLTGEHGSFVGTYTAETTIPRNALFISDNKFWYSNGNKKMKAFRAYFDLQDVLTDMDSQSQQSRISMSFNNEDSGIKDIVRSTFASNVYYDLQGRKVEKPIKGLYILNGKIVKK